MTDTTALDRLAESLQVLAGVVAVVKDAHVPQPKDRVLPIREVAELLGITERSVRNLIAAGELKGRRLLDGTVVLLSDFNAYLRDLRVRNPRAVKRARGARTLADDSAEA